MSDHALVSVQIDAKPKASPDLLFHRMRLLLILYEWKFLSQPSSSMLPPNLLHLSQNGSFLEWRILYHKKIPANLNSHHCFTCKCAAPIAYWNHDFNIYHGGGGHSLALTAFKTAHCHCKKVLENTQAVQAKVEKKKYKLDPTNSGRVPTIS